MEVFITVDGRIAERLPDGNALVHGPEVRLLPGETLEECGKRLISKRSRLCPKCGILTSGMEMCSRCHVAAVSPPPGVSIGDAIDRIRLGKEPW